MSCDPNLSFFLLLNSCIWQQGGQSWNYSSLQYIFRDELVKWPDCQCSLLAQSLFFVVSTEPVTCCSYKGLLNIRVMLISVFWVVSHFAFAKLLVLIKQLVVYVSEIGWHWIFLYWIAGKSSRRSGQLGSWWQMQHGGCHSWWCTCTCHACTLLQPWRCARTGDGLIPAMLLIYKNYEMQFTVRNTRDTRCWR